ncbi:hypothetical protein SAMN03159512_03924 [Pseudomonas sp. NFR09]|nr:hypothetical protein SAMN03159512_03924 [Pseudomonas sp. NFR09]
MKITLTALLLIGLAMPAFADTTPIGFKNISVPDAQRPLQMVVWYPAASGEHPLVVLSHGYGGEGPTGR